MKLLKFNIIAILAIILTSCNVYPDGISDVAIIGYSASPSLNHNNVFYHSIEFYDLNDQLEKYRCSESSSPSYIEDAFIRQVISKVKSIHQDSIMIMKIDFDKFQVLEANRIVARNSLDSIALNYYASDNKDKTKEQIELEDAELKLTLMGICRLILFIVLIIGIFKLVPKIVFLIKYITKSSSIKYELDRRRKSDEREIKNRIISELKDQGYDERSIKDVYDELSKDM